jgi:hypothetical protein
MVELATPRQVGQGEAAQLQVTTGRLPSGGRLIVMTPQGEILGAVTTFSQVLGSSSTTAAIPVPRSAISGNRVPLKLQVLEPGQPPRSPRPEEVTHLDLVLVPASE